MSVSNALLAEAKCRLNITWQDEQTDLKLASILAEGMAYIDNKLGEPGDYEAPGYSRLLLMEYARYARDEALDVFEQNYLALLLAARDERRVAALDRQTDSAVSAANAADVDQPDV